MKQNRQRANKQNHCASHADLRFLAQIFFAEDAFQLLGAPEHEERHEDDEHDHRADGDAEDLVESQTPESNLRCCTSCQNISSVSPKRNAPTKSAEHEEHAVDLACGSRCQRSGGAEPADDKANAHDESADDARGKIGWVDPDLAEIEDAESDRGEEQNHGGDDGGEHDLEHGQFGEVELTRRVFLNCQSQTFQV